MGLKNGQVTVEKLIIYFVIYGLLDRAEAEHARLTGVLPNDILERLRIAEQIGKN